MIRIAVGFLLTIAFTAGWCLILSQWYVPYRDSLVPAETREEIAKTLLVTADQRKELNRAARIADELAFGLMGLLVGGIVAGSCGRGTCRKARTKAALTGCLLGAITGALAGYIGHSFQAKVNIEVNTTVHAVLRLIAMLLPFAIAVGFAAALSGVLKRDVMDTVVGATAGMFIAAAIYGFASDAIPSTMESETDILPHHLLNRVLLMGMLSVFMILIICSQTLRAPKVKTDEVSKVAV